MIRKKGKNIGSILQISFKYYSIPKLFHEIKLFYTMLMYHY